MYKEENFMEGAENVRVGRTFVMAKIGVVVIFHLNDSGPMGIEPAISEDLQKICQ